MIKVKKSGKGKRILEVIGKLIYHKHKSALYEDGLRMLYEKGYLIFTKPTEDGSIPELNPDEWAKMIGEIDWRNE